MSCLVSQNHFPRIPIKRINIIRGIRVISGKETHLKLWLELLGESEPLPKDYPDQTDQYNPGIRGISGKETHLKFWLELLGESEPLPKDPDQTDQYNPGHPRDQRERNLSKILA
ncbi:MAG: hypothetical protein ACO1O6_09620 [Bacteroidota bacterium]